MKNVSKVLATVAIALGFANSSFAQATATASASATIVTPISIVKNTDMAFGNVAVSATAGGTVILATTGSRTTGGTGVTLPATTGTVTAADFTVSGQGSYTYAITLPTTATLSNGSGGTMGVATFTSSPSLTGALAAGGTQDLKVGATLTVGTAQASGTYTNSTAVPVTVNYN